MRFPCTGLPALREGLLPLLVFLLASPVAFVDAHALDLGDLRVPPARLTHPNGTSRWYPPIEPADTTSWDQITVTGCNLSDNATDDEACVDNAIAKADSDPTVIYFPAGTYNFHGTQTINVRRSNFVLRCEDPATTTLKFHDVNEGLCALNADAWICFGAPSGAVSNTTTWTAGFAESTTVLTVASTTGYAVGDWIRARMDDGSACFDGDMDAESFYHFAKVTAVGGGKLTIDRPLRMDYAAASCGTKHVDEITVVEQVGIENCHIQHAAPTSYGSSKPGIAFERAANAWATGNHIDDWYDLATRSRQSARILIAHNAIEDIRYAGASATGGLDNNRTTETWVIDNVFKNVRVGAEFQYGADGGVFAHNYQVPGFAERERSVFLHGRYTREILIEANDTDASPQADSFWGRQGPRNTWYRNRHHPTTASSYGKSLYLSTHHDGGLIADQLTWIANHSNRIMQGPPFPTTPTTAAANDVDQATTNFWLEKNVTFEHFTIVTPEPTTDCGKGTGPAGCAEGPTNFKGENYQGSGAPAAWDGFVIPDSLYLTAVPDWWCQEACPFGQDGIGAFGDAAGSAYCRLPAQIRYEGRTCTPMGGPGPDPDPDPVGPPVAPILLD
jgi:hypothetical protein